MKHLIGGIEWSEIEGTVTELHNASEQVLHELPPMDGVFEHNNKNQIRTAIIQDPSYEQYKNRLDSSGAPMMQKYSHQSSAEDRYPFNGGNSVDSLGMEVSVVWLDGPDGGLYNSLQTDSTPNKKAQRLLLTFPQCWSDLDRSCGDFSLPVVGTVCRIAMIRNNLGMYMGALPLDKSKMPDLRLGDFLRRHYNQNAHYITETSTKDAFMRLDKDIHKSDPICETRGTEERPKNLETDPEILSNLHMYHSNRIVQAADGISTSAKKEHGKHGSVDNKRTMNFNTNQGTQDALNDIMLALGGDSNLSSVLLQNIETLSSFVQTNSNKFLTDTTTNLSSQAFLTAFGGSLTLSKLHSALLQTNDGNFEIITDASSTLSAVMGNLSSVLATTKSLKIVCKDSIVMNVKTGGALAVSSLTTTYLETVMSTLGSSTYFLAGSNGIKIKTGAFSIELSSAGVLTIVSASLNLTIPVMNVTGAINLTGTITSSGPITAPNIT